MHLSPCAAPVALDRTSCLPLPFNAQTCPLDFFFSGYVSATLLSLNSFLLFDNFFHACEVFGLSFLPHLLLPAPPVCSPHFPLFRPDFLCSLFLSPPTESAHFVLPAYTGSRTAGASREATPLKKTDSLYPAAIIAFPLGAGLHEPLPKPSGHLGWLDLAHAAELLRVCV